MFVPHIFSTLRLSIQMYFRRHTLMKYRQNHNAIFLQNVINRMAGTRKAADAFFFESQGAY